MPVVFATFEIKIGGSSAKQLNIQDDIVDVEVENSLHLPDAATLRVYLRDTSLPASFDIGKVVEIKASAAGGDGALFKGEITSLSVDYEESGRMLAVVQATDKSHRLHRGRKTQTFLKKKISDIASQLARDAGLSADVEATSVVYEYMFQAYQTNWEFLKQLANRIGYVMFSSEGKLYFKKSIDALGQGPELKWGDNLREFRTRMTAASQVSKVTVHGWDHKQKQAIVGQATPPATYKSAGIQQTGGELAKSKFGNAELDIMTLPVVTQAEAKTVAEGIAGAVQLGFIEAEGEAVGIPNLLAGRTVTLKGLGDKFNGKYFVTSTLHRFSLGVYTTYFTVSGSRATTLAGLMSSDAEHGGSHIAQGVVTGLVTDSNDPEKYGRVKVKFPWMGDNIGSDWIRIASPDAGPQKGFMWLPEVNDEVLVAFEHGDISRPYVIGSLWNGKDAPPLPSDKAVGNGKVNQRIIKSRSGHVIILNDESNKEQIIIRDKTEKNEIIINSKENTLTIKVDKDISIEAGGKIDIKGAQAISIESSSQDVTISCNNFKVDAKSAAEIKANSQLNLQASGQANLKGAMVNLG